MQIHNLGRPYTDEEIKAIWERFPAPLTARDGNKTDKTCYCVFGVYEYLTGGCSTSESSFPGPNKVFLELRLLRSDLYRQISPVEARTVLNFIEIGINRNDKGDFEEAKRRANLLLQARTIDDIRNYCEGTLDGDAIRTDPPASGPNQGPA